MGSAWQVMLELDRPRLNKRPPLSGTRTHEALPDKQATPGPLPDSPGSPDVTISRTVGATPEA